MADAFCKLYDKFIKVNGLAPARDKLKQKYHRDNAMSDTEVITILILFHLQPFHGTEEGSSRPLGAVREEVLPGTVVRASVS